MATSTTQRKEYGYMIGFLYHMISTMYHSELSQYPFSLKSYVSEFSLSKRKKKVVLSIIKRLNLTTVHKIKFSGLVMI